MLEVDLVQFKVYVFLNEPIFNSLVWLESETVWEKNSYPGELIACQPVAFYDAETHFWISPSVLDTGSCTH